MAFRLTPFAEADIEAIVLYTAVDGPSAVLRLYEEILSRCRAIGDVPNMGTARPEVRPNLRIFAAGSYLVLYREAVDGAAEITRVLHGARQWQELL